MGVNHRGFNGTLPVKVVAMKPRLQTLAATRYSPACFVSCMSRPVAILQLRTSNSRSPRLGITLVFRVLYLQHPTQQCFPTNPSCVYDNALQEYPLFTEGLYADCVTRHENSAGHRPSTGIVCVNTPGMSRTVLLPGYEAPLTNSVGMLG